MYGRLPDFPCKPKWYTEAVFIKRPDGYWYQQQTATHSRDGRRIEEGEKITGVWIDASATSSLSERTDDPSPRQ